MKRTFNNTSRLLVLLVAFTACTKSRRAELSDDQKASVFAISEFGETSDNTQFSAELTTENEASVSAAINPAQAFNTEHPAHLLESDVSVPVRMKFMFNNLPVSNLQTRKFKITFSVDKDYVTSYKVAAKADELSVLERSIALTPKEVQLIGKASHASTGQMQALATEQKKAQDEKDEIRSGKRDGALLVPLFKYRVEAYGTVERTKNELKEDTSKLELKKSEWKNATHIQLSPQTDNRLVVGMGVEQSKVLQRLFSENKIDNQMMSAKELQYRYSIGMKFIPDDTQVFTRLDANVLHVYEVTNTLNLTDSQARLLQNKAGNQEILSCQDESVAAFIKSADPKCVILLKADVPVAYKNAKLTPTDESGSSAPSIQLEEIQRSRSVGLVQIEENVAAKQMDLSGTLDPDSAVKISDLQGEFFYRRTFEAASNMFLGRTGTSGDMTIVRFELENDRIVVRNQQSLINYTGQGPKDREELMSFPVKYIRMLSSDARGVKLTVPQAEVTTKEKAEYALIDWTKNTVPDSNSPLAFYSGGSCFMATTSLKVTDTDMRLAKDGVLNYSFSGSYTVNPDPKCVAEKDVNSAYWGGSFQFNFNVKERISFQKNDNSKDIQFADNISSMAQSAFNFGVFTLADKVTGNDTLANREGSEKYMPLIHDFRNGKKIKYHVGGLNDTTVTSEARRKLMIEATKQVIEEWNKTLRYAFNGTPLERKGDYVDVEFDENNNTGHLGDLDRNYIWYQELPAENGLLGVAQPAANPRSGTIQSANVIIYSGNTMDQTVALLKMTGQAREYEQMVEDILKKAIEDAKKTEEPVVTAETPKDGGQKPTADSVKATEQIGRLGSTLKQSIEALQLDSARFQKLLSRIKKSNVITNTAHPFSKDMFNNLSKGKTVNYPVTEDTFIKKLVEVASTQKAAKNPDVMELELNKAFLQYGGLEVAVKQALKKRSELLAMAIQFDENTKNRPGCYSYERNDINHEALNLDPDPEKNKMLNFKKNIMSTLSHELGHAFGLLHNFKGSIDKANYEFPEDVKNPTGRNYSSIMDYIADIDMRYAGPGPYDAHALRAAYTGLVEKNPASEVQLVDADKTFIPISKFATLFGNGSTVHFTKSSINQKGLIKYYEQCDDGGLSDSAMCAQFDSGGSATEIVKNLIQDYNRGYHNRNYVWDKINFNGSQKMQILNRNISLFQNIRSFLDEAVKTVFVGSDRPDDATEILAEDELNAAKLGYKFFHELIRTPDAPGISAGKPEDRLIVVPYEYTNDEGDKVKDIRVLEMRSSADIKMTPEKIDTVGIGYDKMFAMSFLLQSTATEMKDDSRKSKISYLDFEQWFMGISDPSESPTMNTVLDILSKRLKVGFFTPSEKLESQSMKNFEVAVDVNRMLGNNTAVATIISLDENKWSTFDPFAEMFKVSKSSVRSAPSDRFNLVKAGQDPRLEDSKVLFASQNALGSSVLMERAVRDNYFLQNKEALQKAMQEIFTADSEKTMEDGKPKADMLAAALVAKLRADNGDGIVVALEDDQPTSATNLERQVATMRAVINGNYKVILQVKAAIESAKPVDLQTVIGEQQKALAGVSRQNRKLEEIPLLALSYNFIAKLAEPIAITVPGGTIPGRNIARLMIRPTKLQDDFDHLQEVTDKLSTFSGIVDPDTVLQ